MVDRKRCPPGCKELCQNARNTTRSSGTYLDELRAGGEETGRVVDMLEDLQRAYHVVPFRLLDQLLGGRAAVREFAGRGRRCQFGIRARMCRCDANVRRRGVDAQRSRAHPCQALECGVGCPVVHAWIDNLTSESKPPPHPTSRTSSPRRTSRLSSMLRPICSPCSSRVISTSFSRMYCTRVGFMRWSSANSPCSSHQREERREKCAISSALTLDAADTVWRGRTRCGQRVARRNTVESMST